MPSAYDFLLSRYLGQQQPQQAGYAPAPQVAAAPSYGTQAAPLESFSAGGRTGNKTKNSDLPQWLRAIGMKGNAYAGGMLKPELRYGFAYKNGKIHFADGTSFKAKKSKGKDGKPSYSYTGADGKATSYSPTDEQHSYNKRYKASTGNSSFLDKVGNTLSFEFDHLKRLASDFDVNNVFFGVDPLGVKAGNAITGRDDKPLVTQLGGATDERFADYEQRNGAGSLGYAKPMHDIAATIAGFYGAQGLGNLAGAGVKSLGAASQGAGTAAAGATPGPWAGGYVPPNTGAPILNGIPGIAGPVAGPVAGAGAGAGAVGAATAGGSIGGTGAASGANGMAGWMDWIGPAISAGSSLIAGDRASDSVAAGSREAIGESRRQFDLVRGDTAGVRALGNAAVGTIADLSGYNESGKPNYAAFHADPGYNFAISEGQNAIDRSAAARGGLLSGGAVKAGVRYATGMADQQYSAFYDRLLQQAGLGNTGIGASAAAGANSASNIGSAAMNAGNNRAGIYMDTAANVNNAAQGGIQNMMLRRYLEG